MNKENFAIELCIRGYLVYRAVWHAHFGDLLACETEFGNIHNPYAVVVVSNGTIMGHFPRNYICHFQFVYKRRSFYY